MHYTVCIVDKRHVTAIDYLIYTFESDQGCVIHFLLLYISGSSLLGVGLKNNVQKSKNIKTTLGFML